jgi:FAD/FMN-containing dehydrogenase
MTTIALPTTSGAARTLRAQIDGAVVSPADRGYDEARGTFNLTDDLRPALIAFPEDEAEVVAVVEVAREHGLRVAPQRSGHNASPLGQASDAIVLRTDALQGVELDATAHTARVRSGAKWANVVPQASELGLAALHGSTPDVSIAGYSLGGGVGWYARKHGLAANSVTAIELVTGDGELVRADAGSEPELFWGLRGGGGGNFGVVTALEFDLYPIPSVYAGILFFPWERSSEVLHAWREWTATAPEEITSVGRILRFPPLDFVPEPFRGRDFVMVEAVDIRGEAEGAEALRPLRALGPEFDTFAVVPPAGISELHMDPTDPLPYVSGHQLLDELPPKAIEDIVELAGPDSGSPLLMFEVRHNGGALSRAGDDHGALATLPGSYMTFLGGLVMDAGSLAANEASIAQVAAALGRYEAGRYLNFVEKRTDAGSFFPPETLARLREVKSAYDPDNVFRANHELGAAR